MSLPKIAIVGAGSLSGRQIYPRIARAGAKLVAVCDLEKEKAEERADQYGGKVYTDLDQMLATEELDGVIICVGPSFHPIGAAKVMQAGLPVYTEKPAAETIDDLKTLIKVQEETKQIYMCAFKKRYAECYRRAKEFIDSEAFGQASSMSIFRSFGPYLNNSPRRDFLLDYGIHSIDLAVYLFGPAAKVYAMSPEPNTYTINLEFKNGAVGSFCFCGHRRGLMEEDIQITGEDSWMTINDSVSWKIYEHDKIVEFKQGNFSTAGGDGGAATGHQNEINCFIQAIQGNAEPVSTGHDCLESMQLYDAIRTSVDEQRLVEIP